MKGSLNEAVSFLKNNDNFTLLCHKRPDGDTIGAAFSLFYTLKSINKNVNILSPDGFPSKYNFLYKENFDEFKCDHFISIDVASPSLLGENNDKTISLCIDHHKENSIVSKYYYVDETAAATCELTFKICSELKSEINKNTANSIFVGLSSDTGCFKYSNTTSFTHFCASKLIEYGACSSMINNILFESKSIDRLNLEKYVLDNIKFKLNNKIAFVYISKKASLKLNANDETFEGIPAILKSIEGVDIAITIKETSKNNHKVSVRTSQNVDASNFAKLFDGGGHIRAAGFTIDGNYKKIIKLIIKQAIKVVDTQ